MHDSPAAPRGIASDAPRLRSLLIGLIAFLTLVDLFATQAILPQLQAHYGVEPGRMGIAVNMATVGMALGGMGVALFGRRIDRRRGVAWALAILAIPTAALAGAPDLPSFATLRVTQGLLMGAAFALTLAHLGERCSASDAAAAFAAYVTGNVASNLVGRLVATGAAEHFGLAGNFQIFAALNLAGAMLAAVTLGRSQPMPAMAEAPRPPLAAWATHLSDPALRSCFAIGFCILFAFIGVFTFVNYRLASEPFGLAPMTLGLVYLVFVPSIVTTPRTGALAGWLGHRQALVVGLGLALLALPLLLATTLPPMLLGLAVIAAGTFSAQAVATGLVSRTAHSDRAAASGLYLASYFLGGLAGSALLGLLFDAHGWPAAVGGVAASLALALLLTARLPVDAAAQAQRSPALVATGERQSGAVL